MHKALALLSLALCAAAAQTPPPPGDLHRTIAALDTALFDAYNQCDLHRFAALLAADLEFYHDQSGLSRGAESTLDALRRNVCGKVRRDLVPGSRRVFPLNGYGAVETGVHRFCAPGHGRCGPGAGEARFVHLWQNTTAGWKLTRIISYDHCSNCVSADDAKPRP